MDRKRRSDNDDAATTFQLKIMFFLQFLFIISIEKGLEPNEARPVDSEITAQSIGPRSLPL